MKAGGALRRLIVAAGRWFAAQLETRPRRARLAIALLLVTCAGNAYQAGDLASLWWPPKSLWWEPDPYRVQLQSVRDALPPDTRIGLVKIAPADAALQRDNLTLTRFALLPMCVVDGDDAPYVLVQGDADGRFDSRDRRVMLEDAQQRWRLLES